MRISFLCLTVLAAMALASPAAMAAAPKAANAGPAVVAAPAPVVETPVPTRLPDWITRPMRAMDPITLRAEGVMIRLWGIKPAQTFETPLELKALDLMDSLIQEQQVNCRIMGGNMPELVAQCSTQGNQDLALQLLSSGYAVVDRKQTYDTVLATAYEKAQENARLNGRGVWKLVAAEEKDNGLPRWLEPHIAFLLPFALVFGPLFGLLVIALITRHWLKTMADSQAQETQASQQKEATLQLRERQVLITTLEGELTENKNKIEAFIVIYNDMLRSLKDTSEAPKFQQAGDIVQKHPNYSKTVFEANVNRLSLLDIKVAGHLSKLYSSMPGETEYINLDPNVPVDTAVKLVEKVLRDADEMLAPINGVIGELQTALPPAR